MALSFSGGGGALCPPFPFLIVLFISLKWREEAGAVSGFLIGALYAGLYAEPPGLSCLSFVFIGYLAGKIAPFIMDTPRIVLFVFSLGMILLCNFLSSLIMSVFYEPMLNIRFMSALCGGIVFAYVHAPLERFFPIVRRYRRV